MLNKILPIIITLVAVAGAGFAAMTLKGGPADVPPPAHGDDHAGSDSHGGGHGGGDHGDSHGSVKQVHSEDSTNGLGYFNFRRNFIVPVVDDQRVRALILINVSIEMNESGIEDAQAREPNIRDAFMKTLLAMSHEGMFNQDITNPDVYSEVQARLLETAKLNVDESVRSILLVDYARQDQ